MRAKKAVLLGVVIAALTGTTSCSPDDSWREPTEKAISVLIEGSNNHGAHDLDPFGTVPDADRQNIVGDARLDESAESAEKRVARAADAADWDTPSCEPISRTEAFALLAKAGDGLPDQPSFRCNVTRDGDKYGQVIVAGIDNQTSEILYDLGPDATGFAVGH